MADFKINLSEPNKLKLKTYAMHGGSAVFSLFRYAILLSVGFIILYPLLFMIVTSIVSLDAFTNSTRVWIPTDFNFAENYKKAIDCLEYGKSFLSSFKYHIISAGLEIVSCAVVGYGFARFNFRGKKILMGVLLLTILVPDMLLLIPRMVNYSKLDIFGIFGLINDWTGVDLRINILNTPFTFWIPSILGVGLRSGILIYIYIQFFSGLPRELEEAAWVDGAGPIRTFLSIAVPSSGVVFITVSVFALIWHWNDSLLSGMFITNDFPLARSLARIETTLTYKYNLSLRADSPEAAMILMAACLLFILPMLVFYMIIQRWFIESIDRVGITG